MARDALENFLIKFMTSAPNIGLVPEKSAVHRVEDVTSIRWFLNAPFQVQLFATPPNYIIPAHTHPNVDSFEVMLGGQMRFSKHGKWVSVEELFVPPHPELDKSLSPFRGSAIRVKPEDLHGGMSGPAGAVFMSVQHWLNGVEPHCVASDYEGKTMGSHHQASVKFGEAVHGGGQEALTWKDAAHLEPEPPVF